MKTEHLTSGDAVCEPDSHSSGNFYSDSSREINHEAERLQSAAVEIANPISRDTLMPFLREGDSVLDLGAGADATLGRSLSEDGLHYIAVDPNKGFVDILHAAGVDARQGDVVNLPLESNTVDAVHMRFLFGWLNEEQRKFALRQSARVLKPGGQKVITVIDYDWMMTDGPAEYMEAVGVVCDVLESFGFDYQYGAKVNSDIERLAAKSVFGFGVEYQTLPPTIHEVDRTIESGLPLIEEAISSLKEALDAIGDAEKARAIEQALGRIRSLASDTNITLPGITAQSVLLTKGQPSPEEQPKERLELFSGVLDSNDQRPTSVDGVAIARQGSNLDEYVRRVQAYEYFKNGMLTSEDMIEGGVLCEASYPRRYLDRSTLFVTIPEDKTVPTAAVRLIETEPDDDPDVELRSLPTAEHLNLSMDNHEIFPEGLPASGVFEVSSSIRNSKESGTFLDMSKVIIGLAAEARAAGYHTGLMTTQVRMYDLVRRLLGEDNFTLIEGPHQNNIPGAADTIEYVCLSVDIRSFIEGVLEHAENTMEASKFSRAIYSTLEKHLAYSKAA